MTATIRLELGSRFFDDHESRELVLHSGTDYVVKVNKTRVTVELHPLDAADLLSDAEFYSDTGDSGQDAGLRASARATVKAIEKQYPDVEVRKAWRRHACELQARGERCPICPVAR